MLTLQQTQGRDDSRNQVKPGQLHLANQLIQTTESHQSDPLNQINQIDPGSKQELECQYQYDNQTEVIAYFFQAKWPNGYECPRCEYRHAYIINSRRLPLYQCSRCRRQTSLTAGTVMEDSRTSLDKWYAALTLMARPEGVNAVQLMQAIRVTYKTAWSMMKKIRESISAFDQQQPLSGPLQAELTFYGKSNHLSYKRHMKEQSCVIMAEIRTEKEGNSPLNAKTDAFSNISPIEKQPPLVVPTPFSYKHNRIIEDSPESCVMKSQVPQKRSLIESSINPHLQEDHRFDDFCYIKLKVANPALMNNRTMPPVLQPMFLVKHVDTTVSNELTNTSLIPRYCRVSKVTPLKRLGQLAKHAVNRTYRGIGPKYLERYWDEFCFRFNLMQYGHSVLGALINLCMRPARYRFS